MKIGITFDLRSEYLALGYDEEETAEFDQIETIDAIEGALIELGHVTDRVGSVRQLVSRLAAGDRWDLVFNICEGLHGAGREAQVPAILDAFGIAYTFSEPTTMVVCLDKAITKTVVRTAGLPTPDWMTVRDMSDLERFELRFPVIAKPVAEGTGKGIDAFSKASDLAELCSVCDRLLGRFAQAVLVEEFLPGREFTIGVLGEGEAAEVIGTLEIDLDAAAEQEVYSYTNKERGDDSIGYCLVDGAQDSTVAEAERIALRAWRAVGGRDAGRLDLRCDAAGMPQLMEINPLAGIHPTHSDLPHLWSALGRKYTDLIAAIVACAEARSANRVEVCRRGRAKQFSKAASGLPLA
jgi:D-alanine-D-alanine ligase